MPTDMEAHHDSVLIKETLAALAVEPSDVVVDATVGGAGHFALLLDLLGAGGVIVGIDADPAAIERGRDAYARDRRTERPIAHLVNDNFRNLNRILARLSVSAPNAILFDLGWSGYQIASPRGFSFQQDEPLLMTYGDPSTGLGASGAGETAASIVNSSSEAELVDIISTYGEERFARPIARAIIAARANGRILTTSALVIAIKSGTPSWYHERKIHPATKTFQALRIAVNDEIGALQEGLAAAITALAPAGRLAVISFHSIEDRIVKNILRDAASAGLGALSPKKPITATRAEIIRNRRARSAKLRVFTRSAVAATAAVAGTSFSYA